MAIMKISAAMAVLIGGCQAAHADETTTYSYDALGRLVATGITGGPNSGISTGTIYDPAGNRSTYVVSGSTASISSPAKSLVMARKTEKPPKS
jgi:YD repeat-containing protein